MNKEKKNLLVFGYGLGVIAACCGILGYMKHGFQLVSIIFFACCCIFITVTSLDPWALRPGYRGWMKVSERISKIVTGVILSIIFAVIFVPIGLFFRAIGKDHLEREIDLSANTYWRKRKKVAFLKENYQEQF